MKNIPIVMDEEDDDDDKPGKPALIESTYEKLMKRRIIWLGDEVTNENSNAISAQMLLLSEEDPKADIYLFINSPGGSISDGMMIYNTMRFIKPDVVTVAIGLAASMGQFLLSAGAKGKRFALPYASIMMHQPTGGLWGRATDMRVEAQQLLESRRILTELIAKQTGKSVKDISKDMEKHDNWFTAEQAKEYGLIDKVIETEDELPVGVKVKGDAK